MAWPQSTSETGNKGFDTEILKERNIPRKMTANHWWAKANRNT